MRDTPKWQATIIAATAAFVGSVVGVTLLNLIWKLAVEPATCDTRRHPDGSFVLPLCSNPLPPGWLFTAVSVVGALLGYWIYRLVRDRRSHEEQEA